MDFVISSTVLAKKCQGLYTKIYRKGQECYLKLNEKMFVEYFITRNEETEPPRWELIEQSTSKIRAFHHSNESCEYITSSWTIFQGSNRRKAVLKFELKDVPKKGRKRGLEEENDASDKKTAKRMFGR